MQNNTIVTAFLLKWILKEHTNTIMEFPNWVKLKVKLSRWWDQILAHNWVQSLTFYILGKLISTAIYTSNNYMASNVLMD